MESNYTYVYILCKNKTRVYKEEYLRLLSLNHFSEMVKDVYTVGRADSCDHILSTQEMRSKWLNVISKEHFRIYKERICNSNETVVYLEDMSQNGTFVDKVRIGRGNRVIIESNSEIALSCATLSSK